MAALALTAAAAGAAVSDWPAHPGPNFDYSYQTPPGVTPARSDADIELVWESQALFGTGAYGKEQVPTGGCATPIVYGGKVYLWTQTPSVDGDAFDRAPITRHTPGEYAGDTRLFRYLDGAIVSSERITCLDAATGMTVWERVFPNTGVMVVGHKETIMNQTMAAANGLVYAFGSDRHLYCLDAATGALRWRVRHWNYVAGQELRAELLAKGRQHKTDRNFNQHLLVVDGVLVAGDNQNAGSLSGYDAATGRHLWDLWGWASERSNPKVWAHADRRYLLTAGDGRFALVDPQTGVLLWTVTEGVATAANGFAVQGDDLFINRGVPEGNEVSNGRLACYGLTLNGPILRWEGTEEDGFAPAKNQSVFVHGERVFQRARNRVQVYRLADGHKLATLSLDSVGGSPAVDDTAICFRVNDYLYQVIDSQHSVYETAVIDLRTAELVGQFNLTFPGLSYSSHMLPVPHGDKLLFRRSYGRISCLTFAARPTVAASVTLDPPIAVVAEGEPARFTARVSGAAVREVRFLVDGEVAATIAGAPFEWSATRQRAGVHQVRAVAVGEGGEEYSSHPRLLEVVDWEVRMFPKLARMDPGESRRFIPLAFDRRTGQLLPQRFQPLAMSTTLDNTFAPPHAAVTLGHEESFRAKATFAVTQGAVDQGDPMANTLDRFLTWGSYTPPAPGQYPVVATITHHGVSRSATSLAWVRAPGERFEQRFVFLAPTPVFSVGGPRTFLRAALDSALSGSVYRVLSGSPGQYSGPTTYPVWSHLTPGKVEFSVEHPGDDRFGPAPPVRGHYFVRAANATLLPLAIDFPPVPDQSPGAAPWVVPVSSPSAEPVRLSVASGPATLDGHRLSLTGQRGLVTLVAEHYGDHLHAAALPVVREFRVGGTTSLDVWWPSGLDPLVLLQGSNEPVEVAATSTEGAVTRVDLRVDGTVWATKTEAPFQFSLAALPAGPRTLQAVAFSANGETELSPPRTVDVVRFAGVRLEAALGPLLVGDERFVRATALDERGRPLPVGLAPAFVWRAEAGLIESAGAAATYRATSAGDEIDVGVTASLGGVERGDTVVFSVQRRPQSLHFEPPPPRALTDPPLALMAESSAGLPVMFRVVSGPATIQPGGLLAPTGVGLVEVEAAQPGDGTYDPAPPVRQTLRVKAEWVADSVVVSPASLRLGPGQSADLVALALDSDGDPLPGPLTWTWTAAGGGVVSPDGSFAAGQQSGGPWTVTAATAWGGSTVAGTADVWINELLEVVSVNLDHVAVTWDSLAPDATVGVVPAAYWNNVLTSATNVVLADLRTSQGRVSPMTLTFATGTARKDNTPSGTGHPADALRHAGLGSSTSVAVTLGNLLAAFPAGFDLVVYSAEAAQNRRTYRLSAPGTAVFAVVGGQGAFDGTWTRVTSTDTAQPGEGEYVRWDNLEGLDTLTITSAAYASGRSCLSGFQVIPRSRPPAPGLIPRLRLRAEGTAGGWTLAFDSVPGVTYQLQRAPSPLGPWSDYGDNLPGDGTAHAWELPVPGPEASTFFRLRAVR